MGVAWRCGPLGQSPGCLLRASADLKWLQAVSGQTAWGLVRKPRGPNHSLACQTAIGDHPCTNLHL